MKPQLVIAGLNFVVNIVLLRKYFPVYLSYKVLPMISSRNFSISSFTIRPLFFLESIVQGDGYGSLFNLLHLDILISQPHFCFFFLFFIKYQLPEFMYTHVGVFYFVLLAYMCVFVKVPYYFYYYCPIIYLNILNDNISSIHPTSFFV